MKSFLAGVAVALAAAVVYEKRQSRREKRPARRAPRSTGLDRNTASLERRDELSSAKPSASGKEIGEAEAGAARANTSAPVRARSPEEVLNSATRQQLLSVYGIGPVLADRIIQNRPYAAAYDVVEQGIVPESLFVQLRKQLLEQHSA